MFNRCVTNAVLEMGISVKARDPDRVIVTSDITNMAFCYLLSLYQKVLFSISNNGDSNLRSAANITFANVPFGSALPMSHLEMLHWDTLDIYSC